MQKNAREVARLHQDRMHGRACTDYRPLKLKYGRCQYMVRLNRPSLRQDKDQNITIQEGKAKTSSCNTTHKQKGTKNAKSDGKAMTRVFIQQQYRRNWSTT